MSACCQYETDLTDEQWEVLSLLLPAQQWHPGGPGRPPCDRRRVLNGILYVNKTGCQWRMLPKDFGPWKTVYGYFRRWRRAGVWQWVMTDLRQVERRCHGRLAEPSAGAIDSQSVKTATQSQEVGSIGIKNQRAQAPSVGGHAGADCRRGGDGGPRR
jgi:putative transposase